MQEKSICDPADGGVGGTATDINSGICEFLS
jgi:hypothetical protein